MTDCIRLNAIITIIMITFFFKFFLNHCCQSLKLYRYIYYLYYFGKYMIIYSLYQNEQVICLIRTVLFYLSAQVLYSSVLLSMAVSISSSIQKLAKFRCHDQSCQANGKWNNLLTRERNKISNVCYLFKSRWEGIFVSCLWIHQGRGNAVILLHSSSFFTRGNVSETLAKSFKRFHWETRA